MDIIARGMANGATALAEEVNAKVESLPNGVVYRGAVDYRKDLPTNPTLGDAYTIRFLGDSGAEEDGTEVICSSTSPVEWVDLGPNLTKYLKKEEFNTKVGDLSTLTTTDKGSVIRAVNEVNSKAKEPKNEIAIQDTRPIDTNIVLWVDSDEEGDIINPDDYVLKTNMLTMTKEEYETLEVKDPNTFYFISEE